MLRNKKKARVLFFIQSHKTLKKTKKKKEANKTMFNKETILQWFYSSLKYFGVHLFLTNLNFRLFIFEVSWWIKSWWHSFVSLSSFNFCIKPMKSDAKYVHCHLKFHCHCIIWCNCPIWILDIFLFDCLHKPVSTFYLLTIFENCLCLCSVWSPFFAFVVFLFVFFVSHLPNC